MADFPGWDSKALSWGPDGGNNVATVSSGGNQDRLWVDSVRAPSSSRSNVNNTGFENDYKALSWNPDSVNKLEKNYGTGEYSTAPGLTAFDTSPVFTAQSGPLADRAGMAANAEVPKGDFTNTDQGPSARPYLWKYQ